MTRILIAFDKFKDAVTAQEAGEAVARAVREMRPEWTIDQAPLADGGEGFATILTRVAGGREMMAEATGPRGERRTARFGLARLEAIPTAARSRLGLPPAVAPAAEIAVIEMAAISGLALLPAGQRDPWHTTTQGTGELMQAAAEAGAAAILLGVGGSATNDLGFGALAALGLTFFDAGGAAVGPIPARWPRIVRIGGGLRQGFPTVRIACDVTNPLLGPRGAAAVYGPQKGLRAGDLTRLEAEAARLADMLCAHCGRPASLQEAPGAGAAGGIAFGLMTAAGAQLLPGIDLVSDWLDLDARISAADLVVTGEGRFDESSLEGKGPGAVAARAVALGKTVHVFAGQVTATARPGLALHAITPPGTPRVRALAETAANLGAAARAVFAP